MNMEKYLYLFVKTVCFAYLSWRLWIFLFCRSSALWGRLMAWARLIHSEMAKRRMVNMKKERRKPVMQSQAINGREEEVIGKTKIVYLEDPERRDVEPVRSEPLPASDFIGEDDEISDDEVENSLSARHGSVNDILSEEEKREMMEPVGAEPDADFSEALTYEDMKNVADVLTAQGNVSEENCIRAAKTLYNIRQTDIFGFMTSQIGNMELVENLLRECLDEQGTPLKKRKKMQDAKKTEVFDWNKFV